MDIGEQIFKWKCITDNIFYRCDFAVVNIDDEPHYTYVITYFGDPQGIYDISDIPDNAWYNFLFTGGTNGIFSKNVLKLGNFILNNPGDSDEYYRLRNKVFLSHEYITEKEKEEIKYRGKAADGIYITTRSKSKRKRRKRSKRLRSKKIIKRKK